MQTGRRLASGTPISRASERRPPLQSGRKPDSSSRGLSEDREKIQALYDYVSADIRYLGLLFGMARYQPHVAGEVLEHGYGDCKDKHTLLESLLSAAGYEASPVIISAVREVDPDVPSPQQFEHMITAVHLGDGLLFLDATSQLAPFAYLPPTLRDKEALLLTDDVPARLVRTPSSLPIPNRHEVELSGEVSEKGVLTARVIHRFRGR